MLRVDSPVKNAKQTNFSVEIWKRSFQKFENEQKKEEEDNRSEDSSEQKMGLLEIRLQHREAQVLNLEKKLLEKDGELDALNRECNGFRKLVSDLERREKESMAETQEACMLLQESHATLNTANAGLRMEKERCKAMEMSLKKKIGELRSCKNDRDASHLEAENLRKKLELEEKKLQEADVKIKKLESSVEDLQRKADLGEDNATRLLEANAKIGELECTVEKLQEKLELGEQGENAKIKELETTLAKVLEFVQERDKLLDASEWTVQHLGLHEISKVKQGLSEVERKLKSKEDELADMESFTECLKRQLRKVEAEYAMVQGNLEAFSVKYDGLKADYDGALLRTAEYAARVQQEEGRCNELKVANDKLNEALMEIQMSNKSVVEQMSLLHQSLLQENRQFMEDENVEQLQAMPHTDNSLVVRQNKRIRNCEEKENIPNAVCEKRQRSDSVQTRSYI